MSLFDFDLQILQIFNSIVISFPAINTLLIFLSYTIYVYILFVAVYFFRKKDKKNFAQFIFSLAIGLIFVYILKYAINRPRPYISNPALSSVESSPSFPSSHAFISFLMIHLTKNLSNLYKILNILYLISISISVIAIGEHYTSDVLAGAILGYVFPYFITEKISTRLWNFFVAKIPFLNKFLDTL